MMVDTEWRDLPCGCSFGYTIVNEDDAQRFVFDAIVDHTCEVGQHVRHVDNLWTIGDQFGPVTLDAAQAYDFLGHRFDALLGV